MGPVQRRVSSEKSSIGASSESTWNGTQWSRPQVEEPLGVHHRVRRHYLVGGSSFFGASPLLNRTRNRPRSRAMSSKDSLR